MVQRKACDVCHRRKIQCDSSDPSTPCNWCEHHGLVCTFDRVRGRRKRKPIARDGEGTDAKTLSQRLQHLEETLAKTLVNHQCQNASHPSSISNPSPPSSTTSATLIGSEPLTASACKDRSLFQEPSIQRQPHDALSASPGAGDTPGVAFEQIHFGGCHFGRISHHNGMPILSEEGRQWISQRTGEEVSFEKFRPVATQEAWLSLSGRSQPRRADQSYDLPPRDVVQQALGGFQRSCCIKIFPMLDPVLFQDTVDLAYEPLVEPLKLSQITARCCVLAFLSIAFLFSADFLDVPKLDSDDMAARSHHMLADVLEDSSVVSLQAIFMLHLYQTSTGRLQSAAMLHSLACRSVFMLGGHAYRPIKPSEEYACRREREGGQLRSLFWLCYIFDKDISLRLNQPPLLTDDYCDLTLPDGYLTSRVFVQAPGGVIVPEKDEKSSLLFPGELRLSMLKNKIARLLYSQHAARKTEAELFHDIRQLDEELDDWRQSLSPEFRPCLSISDPLSAQYPILTGPLKSMRRIVMHLEYHHLMTTIHRASGRCPISRPGSSPAPDANPYGGVVQSSIDLTLEASRSTIIFLRTATRGLAGEAFWSMVFYPTAAIMALFLNVLESPLAPQAKSDLELLQSAAQTIRSMPVPRMTIREIQHMQLVDEFVRELVRLGHCAIAREQQKSLQTHHAARGVIR